MKKFLIYTSLIIIVGLMIFFLARYYYVFGEGVKAGQLNYVVKKGYIFKTYEGKLIQSGFRATTPGSIQSYEFEFSITNKRIADSLMLNSGKEVEVHYKEYLGSVPWRGYSEFIVDSIISVHEPSK
jgi:hypothetical protein